MDLSIIIVNWNCAAYTAQCISSIRAFTRGLEYEIIVVDNASSDDSVRVLQAIPGIRLMGSPENLGFAKANNLGSQHSSGKVLLFLNPDTELNSPAINRLNTALKSSPSVGIVGCRLLNSDLSLQTSCIQPIPTILNQIMDIEVLKLRFPQIQMWGIEALFTDREGPVPVEAVCGAGLMIKREVFERVGLFSKDYFMYGEDLDLCDKVRKAGWQVCYVADVTIVHHGGQSTKKGNNAGFGDVVTRQAVYTFFEKTRGTLYARAYRASMGVASVLRLIFLGALSIVPLGRMDRASARRKWARILRWSLGLEQWAKYLNPSDGRQAAEIKN